MLLNLLRLKRTYRNVARVRQILNVFLKHGFGQFLEQLNLQRLIPFRKRIKVLGYPQVIEKTIPERLRIAFSELGPSFIKLAQLLSARPDLITKPYADEFKKLQDEVPPFHFIEVKKIIEEDMGVPLTDLFSAVDEKPLAAASIAQVHSATLLDGSDVIIKVQRPNIKDIIETDISILSTLASLMVKYIPEAEFFNPVGIVEEFSKTVRKELNFIEESKNICRFRKNFADHPNLYIPKTFPEFISERVIVMERLDGVRIDDIKGIKRLGLDRTVLARIGVDAYFKMMLEDGFFHADPHPGNIFAMPDGKIGLMDFGIVGWLSPELMESIAAAFVALINRDFDALIGQYIELGLITEETDIEGLRREFKSDIMDLLTPLYGLTLAEINFAQFLDTITHLAIKHKMRIPSDLLLVNKSMLILDNIGRQLDPNLNFIAVAEPYATKLIRQRYSPKRIYNKVAKNVTDFGDFLVTTPKQLKVLIRKALKDDLHFRMTVTGLDRLIRDIDRSTNRLAFSIVIAAIIMSSAVLTLSGVGGKIFDMPAIGMIGFIMAFILGVWLIVSIIRSGRL